MEGIFFDKQTRRWPNRWHEFEQRSYLMSTSGSGLLDQYFQSSLSQESFTSVDVKFLTVVQDKISEASQTHFGFSTSLAEGISGSGWVFVGAPKSNVSITGRVKDYFEPGAIWRCNLGPNIQRCEILHFLHELCKDPVKKNRGNFGVCDSNFMGGSLKFENDVLVACAPNWRQERRGSSLGHRMDGACYWLEKSAALGTNLTQELTQQEQSSDRGHLIPFQDRIYLDSNTYAWRLSNGEHVIRWHFAGSGFSVHVSKKKEILLGAPTTHLEKGSIVKMEEPMYTNWSLTNLETYRGETLRSFNHFGYGITSGNYFEENVILYAASSPLGSPSDSESDYVGVVLVVEAESFLKSNLFRNPERIQNTRWEHKAIITGTYFGAYFGAALESLDINNDGLDDLIVGAPFEENTGRRSSSAARIGMKEHGCVHIYTTKGTHKFPNPAKTFCGMDAGGRFGTSIGKLGDLNQDGYNDFAVGAPYDEDGGSVYIFYGSENLDLKNIVIRGKDYKPHLRFSTFGFSISGGVDIDGNGTPDFSVGSYADKNVVIFRTRPRIIIETQMHTYINNIAEDPVTLQTDARKFQIKLCANISIVSNNNELLPHENNTTLHAEIAIDKGEQNKRFTINGDTVTFAQFVFSASENQVCRNFVVERMSEPSADQLQREPDVTVEYKLWYNETAKASPQMSVFEITHQNDALEINPSISTSSFADFCANCPYPMITDPEMLDIVFERDG
ncbi:unnamed protein product [Allacma fusca]|uniref:Uncharacterized protein n=1 Tax=Allacma fusca TaxID=39272 RepID=A0A8J2K691_9HEXA|nr:unnamed protein product [Allacma fusca]